MSSLVQVKDKEAFNEVSEKMIHLRRQYNQGMFLHTIKKSPKQELGSGMHQARRSGATPWFVEVLLLLCAVIVLERLQQGARRWDS